MTVIMWLLKMHSKKQPNAAISCTTNAFGGVLVVIVVGVSNIAKFLKRHKFIMYAVKHVVTHVQT